MSWKKQARPIWLGQISQLCWSPIHQQIQSWIILVGVHGEVSEWQKPPHAQLEGPHPMDAWEISNICQFVWINNITKCPVWIKNWTNKPTLTTPDKNHPALSVRVATTAQPLCSRSTAQSSCPSQILCSHCILQHSGSHTPRNYYQWERAKKKLIFNRCGHYIKGVFFAFCRAASTLSPCTIQDVLSPL